VNEQGCSAIAKGDPLQDPQDPGIADGVTMPAAGLKMNKGEPVHEITEQENEKGPFKDLAQNRPVPKGLVFLHGKAHGIPDSKEEGREDQVCRGKSVPMRMPKGRVGKGL
jgi:hypothetical protein